MLDQIGGRSVESAKLFDAEYRFMNLVWGREPINSREPVRL